MSAIIICAMVGLIDIEAAVLIYGRFDKFDFVACMGDFFGVVFSSVEIGILIAVKAWTLVSDFDFFFYIF